MPETATAQQTPVGWRSLLRRAAAVYDQPESPLPSAARTAAWGGFTSGADWMRLAMERLRGIPVGPPAPGVNVPFLGVLKYAVASAAASTAVTAALFTAWPVALLGVPLFYAVEAQAVFLFPVALDGSCHPLRDARRWSVRAGGTLRVMAVVMPIAATMLFGGFVGRGFLRSWCLGCLAVCVWYEDLRSTGLAVR